MKIIKYVCEECGKEVDEYYPQIGWVHIDGFGLKVTNGRDEKQCAQSKFFDDRITAKNSVDFCSLKCFVDCLERGNKDES